jgi:hypothetical protein
MFTKTIDRICLCLLGIFVFMSPVVVVAADGYTSSTSSITPTQNAADGKAEFVYAVGEDGKKTRLKTKLITVKQFQKLYPKPNEASRGQALDVGAFSVFHQIKTAEGRTEEGGFYRVSDSQGDPKGWLRKSEVAVWKTRYALYPLEEAISGGVFKVYKIGAVGEKRTDKTAVLDTPPKTDQLRLAVILEPPKEDEGDDTLYDVLCLDRSADQGKGGIKDLLKKLDELSMDIVFVYEATDALAWEIDGVKVKDLLQTLMKNIADRFDEKQVSELVRFGIVAFQDNTSHIEDEEPAPFPVKVIQPLIQSTTTSFRQAINRMPAYAIGGDWPEDGLSGIAKAIDMLAERKYSSKHIVYFGMSSPHEHGQGEPHTVWGKTKRFAGKNSRATLYDTSTGKFTGYTQRGLTVRSIMDRAAPKPGSPLTSKTIHTIMSSAEREDLYSDIDMAKRIEHMRLAPAINRAVDTSMSDAELLAKWKSIIPVDDIRYATDAQQVFDFYESRERGFAVLQKLADTSKGNFQGFHGRADATAEQYRKVANDLFNELNKIVPVLLAAKNGDPQAVKDLTDPDGTAEGKFTGGSFRIASLQSIQDLEDGVDSRIQAVLGDVDSFEGLAPVRDDDGQLVAYKQIMVGREELKELANKLNALVEEFQGKAARANRVGIKAILDKLQQYAIETVTGEEFEVLPDSELKAILTELPLQTSALDITPKNLQVLDAEEFTRWVDNIRFSEKRCLDLLKDESKWNTLTETAPLEKFAFIRLEDMP